MKKISRRRRRFVLLAIVTLSTLVFAGNALAATAPVPLANAASFGVLSATGIANAGLNTVVNGDIGSSGAIGASVTNGTGSKYTTGSTQLVNAQASQLIAYGAAAAATPTQPSITGLNLAGMTLLPGVSNSTSGILLSGGALTLNGLGDPNSVFIIQAAAAKNLTVAGASSVLLTNGAQACNVFWEVQSHS